MKKIIIIIVAILIIIPKIVKAESGMIVGYDELYAKDVYNAPTARFFDITNNTYQLTAIATQYSDGFGYTPNPVTAMEVDNLGPGSAIGFDINEVFLSGYVYGINVYLCASPTNVYPTINNIASGITTGSGLGNTQTAFNNGDRATIIYSYNQFSTTLKYSNGNSTCGRLMFVFEPNASGTTIITPFRASAYSNNWTFFGYNITNYGQRINLTQQDIENIVQQSTSTTYQSISDAENSINNNINSTRSSINNTINQGANQIDGTLNDMIDMDIDNTTKQDVNKNDYNAYKQKEDELMNITTDADMSILDIGLDTTTSNKIWEIMTTIIQQNVRIFAMFISILSIGIMKLVLRR